MPAMMPERLANSDPFKQITEIIGSGPYRYLADERLQGSRNVYARFDKYRPREGGTPDWTAGPKIVHFDRVEWTTMPDAATAAAVQSGGQDWWEYLTHDLMPLTRKNPKVKVSVQDPAGQKIRSLKILLGQHHMHALVPIHRLRHPQIADQGTQHVSLVA
jgi:peptide/nickel transport system substrate-binding protein